jgi:Xaa-Pro aminopeptidase
LDEVVLKHRRVADFLELNNLSAVLLKKQPNFSWFTGGGLNMVGIATEMGVTSLLITRGARYVLANRIEAARMMEDEGLAELGFELLDYEWYADKEAALVRTVSPDLGRVGADSGFATCPNVDGEFKKLRYSLTENEIERYGFLGDKLSQAIEKVMLGIRPGDKECEIAGRIGVDLWRDRIDPTGLQVAADDRMYRYRHPIPTTRMVKRYVMVSVNARYKGLITTVTRILHFGRPEAGLVKQFADNNEIECRMIAAAKQGTPLADAFKTGLAAYKELGYEDEWLLHHQGGAMGYYARDIRVTADTPDLVQDNQAICWNPSIAGTKTEDAFIATAEGPLMITHPVVYPKLVTDIDGVQIVKPGLLIID